MRKNFFVCETLLKEIGLNKKSERKMVFSENLRGRKISEGET